MSLHFFDPSQTLYISGFDRRGCSASITAATSSGFKVTGNWADKADFVVVKLMDADDNYGYLYGNKYLPRFDLTGVIVDFDLAIVNGQYPGSTKFPSVPWASLSWITKTGTPGTTLIPITGTTGQVNASRILTITSSLLPLAGDRVQIIFLGNVVYDYTVSGGNTPTNLASGLASVINSFTSSSIPLTATSTGPALTINCTQPGTDGNTIELLVRAMSTGGTTGITPTGNVKLTGGVDPTSLHCRFDFSTMTLTSLRQCWLTLAPPLPIDSGGSNPALVAFAPLEFSYVFSSWTVTDPGSKTLLKVADPTKSVVVDSRNVQAATSGTWNEEVGFYHYGFSKATTTAGDSITIKYSCQDTHDLYLGTALYSDRGVFSVTVDGVSKADIDCFLSAASQIVTRRILATGIGAGNHTVVLTVKSGALTTCYFDYLHAVVEADPVSAGVTYSTVSAALDWDTLYNLPPARLVSIYDALGFKGNLDFYAGVFFCFRTHRKGGKFFQAVVTISGTMTTGDAYFLNVGGATAGLGVGLYSFDTTDTVAQRLINAVNSLFVGVRAEKTGTGQLTITVMSPIDGFTVGVSASGGATGAIAVTGNIGVLSNGRYVGGQEGIWEIDSSQTLPLNKAFADYLADFTSVFSAASINFTLAFSDELLAPPDANTSGGAWIQRYDDGTPVLTQTGFGSWGAGTVEAVSGSGPYQVTVTGHGYITGYIAHFNGGSGFPLTVVDADHFTTAYHAVANDAVYVELQTSQCAFNPSTVTAYYIKLYKQAAAILAAGGVTPWLQFGEYSWWYFAGGASPSMAYYDAYTSAQSTLSLGRSLATFTDPNDNPAANSHADANLLRSLLQIHIHAIRVAVLAATATTKFELLWPHDVNWDTSYTGPMSQAPIGGRMNRYVNLPTAYMASGSDIDRWKAEALAWGTTYRSLTNALASMKFYASPASWAASSSSYIIPWQNSGCPFEAEFLFAAQEGLLFLVFWALDHAILFSWRVPLPTSMGRAKLQ